MEKINGARTIAADSLHFDAVILADGDYPTHPLPLKVLEEARFLVCCDKAGMEYIERTGKTPDAIVGDGDSLPEAFKHRYADIWHKVDEQDYNDLSKAARYCISQGKRRIAFLGATGKREDHTIGNIFLMPYYNTELHIEPTMITDHGIFVVATGRHTFSSVPGQQISIFRIPSAACSTPLTSEGLKWSAYNYQQLWQGTLNEAVGNTFTIDTDGTYMIYYLVSHNGGSVSKHLRVLPPLSSPACRP